MNPLDMRGPEFLQFYLIYGLTILAVAWLVRAWLLSAAEPSPGALRWSPGVYPREGDAYEIALLRGGQREVARTVLSRLISSGRIALVGRTLRWRDEEGQRALPPIEASALHALSASGDGIDAAEAEWAIHGAVEPHLAPLEDDLRGQGLILSSNLIRRLQGLRLLVLAALLGLGLAKVVVAIGRGRTNLGFLALLLIGYTAAAFFLLRPPSHTRAGRRYLSWLQESHRGLINLLANGRRESGDETALVAGIYGLQALPFLGLLSGALQPPPRLARSREDSRADGGGGAGGYGSGASGSESFTSAGDSGGGDSGGYDSGGGDSGGGDGGGGGCGGGGCGGGGCGGCGS